MKKKKFFNNITLFLSYCSLDSVIADRVEYAIKSRLKEEIVISRYTRDVRYKESFVEFMESIPNHDFVLTIVSDAYLKSEACMYEVRKILKNPKYREKLLFIVLSEREKKYYDNQDIRLKADIYSEEGRLEYICFWQDKYITLKKKNELILEEDNKIDALKKLKEIKQIAEKDIGIFIRYLADANGKNFEQLEKEEFSDIISFITENYVKQKSDTRLWRDYERNAYDKCIIQGRR